MSSALARFASRAPLAIASVLVTLALVECGLRVSGKAPLPETHAGGFRLEDPLVRLLRPNTCNDAGALGGSYYIEVCTNQLGLRDRDHAPGETPRVLGIGDSFTFGWGVEQHDTFLAQFERALRLGLPSVHPGVWSAGLSYTSQAHQDALLRRLYDDVKPDLVVLAFAEDNDIDENIVWNPNLGVFPEQGEITGGSVDAFRQEVKGVVVRDFLFQNSALVRFFRQRHLRASMAAEVAAVDSRLEAHGFKGAPLSRMVADEARRRFLQAFSHKYDDDWRVTEILLERIQRFVADKGGKLALLRIPSRMSVEDSAWASARERFCGVDVTTSQKSCGTLDRAHTGRRLGSYAAEHGLLYVDPESDLRAATERGESMYLPEDIHLSRLGHLRVGERLSEVVVPYLGGHLPSPAPKEPETSRKHRQVGAYWYPWYRGEDWSSFTDYTPANGAYLSTNTKAISWQLHAAERAELDFLMVELLADHNPEAKFNNQAVDAMVSALVERRKKGFSALKFAVLSDIFVGEADIATNERWLEVTRKHLDQIWTRFVEPYPDAYVHVDGKPLVGIFSPGVPIDDPRFTIVRPYWVSHDQWQDWGRKKELVPFWDAYPQTVTDRRFMSVIPGYNDWRLERQPQVGPYLPRLGGATFVQQWRRVFETGPDVVFVYSFNEYFEQSQIEPTMEEGDRYLLLNQILARRYKDGGSLGDAEAARLPDVIEPAARPGAEKVAWLPVGASGLRQTGLESVGNGRAILRDHAELDLDVDSEKAFVVGIAHLPTFDHCAGLKITIAGAGPEQSATFPTEITQLSILRDSPLPRTVGHLKLRLERAAASTDCPKASDKPIVITGVTRYPLATAERLNLHVDDANVRLTGVWDLETPPGGSFIWSRGASSISVSHLTPGVRHKVTLTLRDTAGFGNLDMGPDPAHLQRVVLTPGKTATLAEPLVVGPDGTLAISFKTDTWRPHERFHSEDLRSLGVALRLITLDRIEGVSSPRERR